MRLVKQAMLNVPCRMLNDGFLTPEFWILNFTVETERISKILARRGLCSRREAERLIDAGQVTVDGVVVREQGTRASPDAEILILQSGAESLAARVTVLLHKPVGIVSTLPEAGQVPAWKLLRRDNIEGSIEPRLLQRILADPQSLSVAGRLDRASRGLLVLTQDGAVAKRIVGTHTVEKVYSVRTAEPVTEAQIRKLRGRLVLDGRDLLPMHVQRLSDDRLRFRLVEGRKHQLRRVCRHVGLTVVDLLREAVGPLRLGRLPEGHWRLAGADELAQLMKQPT